jgi:hypothetical protein
MKKNLLLGVCSLGLMVSCATNPLTGRSIKFPNSELFLPLCGVWNVSKDKVITGTTDARVEAVGTKNKISS